MWQCFEGSDLSALQTVWEAAAAAARPTVFQHFAFARHWARAFADTAETRIWVSTGDSPAPLLVPLVLRESRLSLLGDGLFDYLALVGVGRRWQLQEAAERVLGERWSEMNISGVRPDPVQAAFWHSLDAEAEPFAAAPQRHPPPGGNAVPLLEREHPRLLSRWRRARREGCYLRQETELRLRLELLDWLLAQKNRRCAAQGVTNVLGAREQHWLRLMVEHEPQLAELWSWRDQNGPLSALLCWRTARVRYAYTIGYGTRAPERSPGILLLFALLRRTMEAGQSFDFLTGEQAFKRRLATCCQPLLRYRRQREGSGRSSPAFALTRPLQKTA